MKYQELYNVLEEFDFGLLNNSEFKEDSVREEIVLPIIKGLGYSANKPNQIIRSRKLLHPFVSIGSKRKEIFIIPDYLFEIDGQPAWILDAKAPRESIVKSIHVEQAYSYAIHSEVRVKYFALCNGKEFALYNIEKIEHILYFPMSSIPSYWDNLKHLLSPQNIIKESPFILAKDWGLHLKRLGFDTFESLVFPNVPVMSIGQLHPNKFSLSGCINDDGNRYVVTFDFGYDVFKQFIGKVPDSAIKILEIREPNKRQVVNFADRVYFINIDCRVGNNLEENEDEIFLPFWVNRIID
ncbi:hypothetical protein SDC9_32288 [bioreactor metagenome]|uniref:Uncharacterized protein n=1 Tax=bioreactor metagenome TaxID=1076179 RepID=A0A644V4N8_9ZZZZ|nr:type I restriction enzyme HsdR N-terminal domain-containing protein [Macellibacteroides fermentans]